MITHAELADVASQVSTEILNPSVSKNDSEWSALATEAKRVHEKIYERLDGNRLLFVNTLCNLFCFAEGAYKAVINRSLTNSQRVNDSGSMACQVLDLFAFLRQTFFTELDTHQFYRKLDATSEWLRKNGWLHFPTIRGDDGCTVYKTAAGVHDDMRRYYNARKKMEQEAEEKKLAANTAIERNRQQKEQQNAAA